MYVRCVCNLAQTKWSFRQSICCGYNLALKSGEVLKSVENYVIIRCIHLLTLEKIKIILICANTQFRLPTHHELPPIPNFTFVLQIA